MLEKTRHRRAVAERNRAASELHPARVGKLAKTLVHSLSRNAEHSRQFLLGHFDTVPSVLGASFETVVDEQQQPLCETVRKIERAAVSQRVVRAPDPHAQCPEERSRGRGMLGEPLLKRLS